MITEAFALVAFSIPAWPLLYGTAAAMLRWRGVWRGAAALPVVPLLVVVANIVIDTWSDPTSHNLWPFEIIIWSLGGLLALGLLALCHRAFA